MGSFSDYTEAALLDEVFGATDYTPPATVYAALYTVTPGDASASGTEVTGGSYARVAITNNTTNFPNASGTAPTTKRNGTAITFPTATADWGTVVAMAFYDAATTGNEIAWGALTQNKTISNGDSASFAANAVTITLD